MPSRQPLFTVFTPTYNRRHTLHRVYESIRNQTLLKDHDAYIFEWLIVDDGSTDGTKHLVQEWQNTNDFSIRYVYQNNSGKPAASRKGIELAQGELFLFADSDDAFLPETFETFYTTWMEFEEADKKRCGGIGVLCEDQHGNRIGNDYPIEKTFIPAIETVFGWRDKGLGETWAILKTENLKKYFVIPEEAKYLKFIPESFFWNRITFETKQCSYLINKVLRIYYTNEGGNISQNTRVRYPEGFLFESLYFINNYKVVCIKAPQMYLKHLFKFIIFSNYLRFSFFESIGQLNSILLKLVYVIMFIPAMGYKNAYLRGM